LAENLFFEEFCRQIERHINDVSDHRKGTSKISKNTTKLGKRKQITRGCGAAYGLIRGK
jgi:hypothetical protein